MNKRIFKKVYKRANEKLMRIYGKEPLARKRSTLEIEQEERILTPLERQVFLKEQYSRIRLVNKIIEELKAEGEW